MSSDQAREHGRIEHAFEQRRDLGDIVTRLLRERRVVPFGGGGQAVLLHAPGPQGRDALRRFARTMRAREGSRSATGKPDARPDAASSSAAPVVAGRQICPRAKSVGDRLGSQPEVNGKSRRVFGPDAALQTVRREPSGAGEFRAERLVKGDLVHGADERPDQLRDERAVARMTSIARREKLHLSLRNRRDQFGRPALASSPVRWDR